MSRANLAEPVTLVRSPTLTNSDSSLIAKHSKPARRQFVGLLLVPGLGHSLLVWTIKWWITSVPMEVDLLIGDL